jgi:uncharacterized membrane protein (DUF4010 family)
MTPEWQTVFAAPVWRLLTALAIGALIGIERERRKGEGATRGAAGLRTFALIALVGGLCAQLHFGLFLFLGGAFIAGTALVSYWASDRRDPGLTTEVAMFATFLLGVEAQSNPAIAAAMAVVVTMLLAWRSALHRFARSTLSEQELHNGLIFAIAAVVILPLLPDRSVDPFGLINPFALWRIVVVLMGLSGLGYVGVRAFDPRYGLAITGFASGFISSSAMIAAMGARSRAEPGSVAPAAAGAVASTVGSLVYLAALVAAADMDLMIALMTPLGICLAVTLAYASLLSWKAQSRGSELPAPGEAFKFRTVLVFAVLLAAFSILASFAGAWLGTVGVFSTAIAAGAVDVHAAAAAVATLVAGGRTDLASGRIAILLALSANMLLKVPISFATGTVSFGLRVSVGLGVLIVGLLCGALL